MRACCTRVEPKQTSHKNPKSGFAIPPHGLAEQQKGAAGGGGSYCVLRPTDKNIQCET